ncbi:hypothetical protein DENSPDRAFT_882756 [Dentipellis sp. KUC8613]|nr:hypothetical protein DENSPDRAFT_882756 [Dentipellis sp. KUC8613]
MGKKRKRVAAALHSELSEYASLIRVLRTNDALDVVPHLAPATFTPVDDDEGESEIMPSGTLSQRESSPHEDDLESETQLPGKSRDTWTRWPLMADDVHVPEWSFEDEVRLIAQQTLDSRGSTQPASTSGGSHRGSQIPEASQATAEDGEEDEDGRLPASVVQNLATAASIHFEQVLSAIASHTPLVEKSMQNRLKPVGWENVLGMVSASGLMDEKSIINAQHRLEAIYGAARRPYAGRAALVSSSRKELSETLKPYDLSYLDYPSIPTKGRRGDTIKRRRGPYGKRSKDIKEESETSDSSSDDKPLAKRTVKSPVTP